jgi:hypothetical protein
MSAALPGFEHAVRFGERIAIQEGWRAWLARWLGRHDLATAAPASVAAAAFGMQGSTVWIATPVHLIAGLSTVHLDRRSLLRLSPAELESFASDFQRVFSGSELYVKPTGSGEFLMYAPSMPQAVTTQPARALVSDLGGSLPKGPGAATLKRLGAELEMWLHEHPVNDARSKRGEPPVSTLWLWGGGPAALDQSTHRAADESDNAATELAFGSDAYLAGLWHLHGGGSRPLPGQLAEVFGYSRAHRAALVAEVAPMLHANPHWTVLEALAELDRRFVSPALAALGGGDLQSVVLIANDRQFLVRHSDRLKLWRRPHSGIEGLR